jgi:hypothetical protein
MSELENQDTNTFKYRTIEQFFNKEFRRNVSPSKISQANQGEAGGKQLSACYLFMLVLALLVLRS